MALLRLVTLGAGAYLLVILTVALVGRALGHRPTFTLAARLTPPSLRSGLALATAGVALTVSAGAAGAAGPSAPTLRWTGPPSTLPSTTPPVLRWTGPPIPSPSTTPPVLRWTGPAGTPPSTTAPALPWTEPASSSTTVTAPSAPARPASPSTTSVRQDSPPPSVAGRDRSDRESASYVIRPGDSFWNIAATRLRGGGSEPQLDDESVAHYWRLLLRANRRDLPVPGQPDILFPGDRIELPPLP
jgi:nucleoid-associated protein YgaU